MANLGLVGRAYKELWEDWTGADAISTSVADGIVWLTAVTNGDTAFRIVADAQGPILQGLTDATDDDYVTIAYHLLTWSVQHGDLYMETRAKIAVGAVASVAFNIGFNDDVVEDSATLPAELSTATWTSNATDFIGVVYDADATNDDFHVFWVDDGNDSSQALANLRMTGVAPVLDEWFGVAIRLTDAGSGNGAILEVTVVEESTGKVAQKRYTGTIDRDALLTPWIGFENRAGVAHTMEVDYVYVKQSRSAT